MGNYNFDVKPQKIQCNLCKKYFDTVWVDITINKGFCWECLEINSDMYLLTLLFKQCNKN